MPPLLVLDIVKIHRIGLSRVMGSRYIPSALSDYLSPSILCRNPTKCLDVRRVDWRLVNTIKVRRCRRPLDLAQGKPVSEPGKPVPLGTRQSLVVKILPPRVLIRPPSVYERSRPHGRDAAVGASAALEPRGAVFRQHGLIEELVGVSDEIILGLGFGHHGPEVLSLQLLDALDYVVALKFDHDNHCRVRGAVGSEVEKEVGHLDRHDGEVGLWLRGPYFVE